MRATARTIPSIALAAILLLGPSCADGAGAPDVDADADASSDLVQIPLEPVAGVEVANEYTSRLYAGELDALYALFTEEFRESFDRDALQQLHDTMRERYGREVSLVSLQRRESGGYRGFARFAIFDGYEGMVQIRWILRDDDRIAGLALEASPKTPLPPEDS